MKETIKINNTHVRRLYNGTFHEKVLPIVYEKISSFFDNEIVSNQLKSINKSDILLIKPNLGNARPPDTGCITHPVVIRAIVDYIIKNFNRKKPTFICETNTYHKGPGIYEIIKNVSPSEQRFLNEKLKQKSLDTDMHNFGFELLLEMSGIKNLVQGYKSKGFNIDILNLSDLPVMDEDEREKIIHKTEQLLGNEVFPKRSIKRKLQKNIPNLSNDGKKISLISLNVFKTHDEPKTYITGTMKNVALGLFPLYKAFMHKDLAKAIIYNYALWKTICEESVFGIISGPYGQDSEGPIFGRTVDLPYIIAGPDLLEVDCIATMLAFGRKNLVSEVEPFKIGNGKVGQIPSNDELEKLIQYNLGWEPYPYEKSNAT
ncbi:MAG: DUF362 domain-containing protein [Candidatus Hodarchaeota archaeon]